MKEILNAIPQVGTVEWIGLRPGREEPIVEVDSVEVDPEHGLQGDRFQGKAAAPRQITLIQKEHLEVIRSILGLEEVLPATLRRNIVVSGINLNALKNKQKFSIGQVVLLGTGNCAPCSKMETALGPGGYNAMRGHGGLTASVIAPGKISIGDRVQLVTG